MAEIKCPVYGFYGGTEARSRATAPKTAELMKEAKKTYDPVTYEGAGHGFMGVGEDPNGTEPNKKARNEGWVRLQALLKKI